MIKEIIVALLYGKHKEAVSYIVHWHKLSVKNVFLLLGFWNLKLQVQYSSEPAAILRDYYIFCSIIHIFIALFTTSISPVPAPASLDSDPQKVYLHYWSYHSV